MALMTSLDQALRLLSTGFSILPIMADGSKKPTIAWKRLQSQRLSHAEASGLFCNGVGIGIIAGQISGNLEVIDLQAGVDL